MAMAMAVMKDMYWLLGSLSVKTTINIYSNLWHEGAIIGVNPTLGHGSPRPPSSRSHLARATSAFYSQNILPPSPSQTGSATDSYSVKIAQMKHGMFEFQFVITENSLAM